MRWLLAALVAGAVVLVVALGVDALVTERIEESVSRQVADALDAPADVELSGWPVGLHLLSGTLPEVIVNARDVPLEDPAMRLTRLRVVLTDVEVSWTMPQDGELPPARSGSYEAEIDEANVRDLLPGFADFVQVDLTEQGIHLSAAGLSVDVQVSAEDGDLVVRPASELPTWLADFAVLRFSLTELPGEPTVDRVEPASAQLRLSGTLHTPQRQ